MNEYTVNLGLNEKSTMLQAKSPISNKDIYSDYQCQMNNYVTHDLIYDYSPNINGGYIIFVEPGPWMSLLQYDKRLKDKYGKSVDKFGGDVYSFMLKSMKLSFQIDPGAVNASADNYNLRHLNQNVFSYDTKISSISVTYLEENNIVDFTHSLWISFMSHLKQGFVELPEKYLAKDTDVFYQVPYYGQIWAYAFNPVDLRPREIVKYVGVFPSNNTISDSFGQRGQNNHYMKTIQYNVVDYDRSVYPATNRLTSKQHFEKFKEESVLFDEFISLCTENGLLQAGKG